MLCIGCVFFIFSVSALNFMHTQILDHQIVNVLSVHRIEWLNPIAKSLSYLGGMPFVLFLAMLWCLRLAWYKKYSDIVFISTGIIGSISLAWLLKCLISRPRPPEMYFLVKTYGDSFPSGHSLYAAALGCLAMYVYRQHSKHALICLLASAWILLMGVSRVYAGAHYPSDVLSGWSISFIWITLLYWLMAKYPSANK
mgnify:CR=1 FL=1